MSVLRLLRPAGGRGAEPGTGPAGERLWRCTNEPDRAVPPGRPHHLLDLQRFSDPIGDRGLGLAVGNVHRGGNERRWLFRHGGGGAGPQWRRYAGSRSERSTVPGEHHRPDHALRYGRPDHGLDAGGRAGGRSHGGGCSRPVHAGGHLLEPVFGYGLGGRGGVASAGLGSRPAGLDLCRRFRGPHRLLRDGWPGHLMGIGWYARSRSGRCVPGRYLPAGGHRWNRLFRYGPHHPGPGYRTGPGPGPIRGHLLRRGVGPDPLVPERRAVHRMDAGWGTRGRSHLGVLPGWLSVRGGQRGRLFGHRFRDALGEHEPFTGCGCLFRAVPLADRGPDHRVFPSGTDRDLRLGWSARGRSHPGGRQWQLRGHRNGCQRLHRFGNGGGCPGGLPV